MSLIRTRTIETNGLRFTIDEAGDGEDVALCLHGFPESRLSWRHQLPALAALGWRAVAPDLRGYGQSSRPRGVAAYRMEHLITDAAAIFDALGAKRRLLIGHDWGGGIAWGFAIQQARPLEGLIVMNCPHPVQLAEAFRSSWRQRRRSWYMLFFQLPWLPEAMLTARRARAIGRAFLRTSRQPERFPPELIAHYRNNAAEPGAMTAMLNYYRANLRALGGESAPPRVETPTLLIWGEEDFALDLSLLPGTERHVRDLTVRRLPGISHWVQQEAPEAVNAAVAEWLSERGLAG